MSFRVGDRIETVALGYNSGIILAPVTPCDPYENMFRIFITTAVLFNNSNSSIDGIWSQLFLYKI